MTGMHLVYLGDVIGRPGRRAIAELFPVFKERYAFDALFVNGENSAGGRGVAGKSLDELYAMGVDYVSLGDHTYYQQDFNAYLDKNAVRCVRPMNYPEPAAGAGWLCFEHAGKKVALCNIIGRVSMGLLVDCPFKTFDVFVEQTPDVAARIVDFHAEATSEKNAMAHYIDGRAALLCGTHTHVQTGDERVLEKGLGYITDLGMTGPIDSVIGMDKDVALERFLTGRHKQYKIGKGSVVVSGVFAKINLETGRCEHVERLYEQV